MKKIYFIIKSVIVTLILSGFVLSILFKSLFGFWLISSKSFETLANMKQSQKTVQRLKQVHSEKKKNTRKKFLKQSKNRLTAIGGSALPVVGPVVAGTAIITLTINEYCDEQKDIIEQENLLFQTDIEYSKEQCLVRAKQDAKDLLTDFKINISEL